MTLADATTFHNAIPNSTDNKDGTFEIPCSTDVKVTFVIGGGHYVVDTQDLLNPTYDVNGNTLYCHSRVHSWHESDLLDTWFSFPSEQ
jgi:hypothetical protein